MKRVIKNNYKIIIGILIGVVLSVTTVYAVDAYIESNKVSYDNKYTDKANVQDAIDELYERSGIHNEKWVDPILNGADPVLKKPLIPVEIKPNGDVYYANENSEWYNYSEKRWANAIILVDNPSNTNYKIGDHILDSDIKGYFVWIPRYQYKIWDMGEYNDVISNLTNTQDTAQSENALWKVTGNNTRIIDIKFGSVTNAPKMIESEATINKYYTHPAFTLGNKDLNGIWVGKFETGGTSEDTMVIKPNVSSWGSQIVKVFFDAGRNFANVLDSHMMKNTEWGAVAYLSHSKYGIGNKVNINNTHNAGYSATEATNQSSYLGETATSSEVTKTQPWNTPIGYLASTTGNITGIYDMSGGTWEYLAACIKETPLNSGFDTETLASEMNKGYIDKYDKNSMITSFDKRILGDATGELGPFFNYYEINGTMQYHTSWYGDGASFVNSSAPWFARGLGSYGGVLAGQFHFSAFTGAASGDLGFRVALAVS